MRRNHIDVVVCAGTNARSAGKVSPCGFVVDHAGSINSDGLNLHDHDMTNTAINAANCQPE